MTTITIELENEVVSYVKSKWKSNLNLYISNLLKEDMLLNSIKESKLSWTHLLNSLDDLDN